MRDGHPFRQPAPRARFQRGVLGFAMLWLALLGLIVPRTARAASDFVVYPADGGSVLELVPERGAQVGRLVLENRGKQPLLVARVVMRDGTEPNPRVPAGVTALFIDGATTARLDPGEKREISVRWALGKERRLRELYAHVVVESEDLRSVLVGVHGELVRSPSFLLNHALSWLVFLPLAGAILASLARVARYRQLKRLRVVGIAVGGLQLLLAVWLVSRFDTSVSRHDGNEGFQFIERAALLPSWGVDYSLGVDGISAGLILLTALVVIVASLSSDSIGRRVEVYWALLMALDLGLMGCFAALDLGLLLGFCAISVAALALLVGLFGSFPSMRFPLGVALGGAVAVLLLGFVVFQVSARAGPSYLVDGSPVARMLSLPELSHLDFTRSAGTIGGFHAVKVLWCGLFVALGVLAAAAPLQLWAPAVFGAVPAPVAMLLSAGLGSAALYLFLRIGYGVLPDGTAWAAPTLALLGVLGVAWSSFAAILEKDLQRFAAHAASAQGGLTLLALASLTAIGVEGGVTLLHSRAASVLVLLALASSLHDRVRTCDSETLGGLVRELPLLAVLSAVGFLGAVGAPGSLAFVGHLLALLGAFPLRPAATLLAIVLLVPLSAAALRIFGRTFFGTLPSSWQQSAYLEPHGGRFPPLGRRELWALAAPAAFLLGFGLWPQPLLSVVSSSALDQAALVNPPGPMQIVMRESPPGASRYALAALADRAQ